MSFLRCKTAFTRTVKSREVFLNVGDIVSSDDPVVKGCEQHFDKIEDVVRTFAPVEQATAAPGERRSVTPAKKTAAPKVKE